MSHHPRPTDLTQPATPAGGGFGFDLPDDDWLGRLHGALATPTGETVSPDPGMQPGARLGPYELLEVIGTGGMGTVWRARRSDDSFDREVAIKLIRRGMDSEELVRRFQFERQVLARLEHPGIARLYDGGASESGQPYLVLEHIARGAPIHEYCRQRGLDIDAILALFGSVCGAVHFAHSNLVLHRDIKPSNVLVTPDGEVKLLDFGIAKLLDEHDAAITQTSEHPILTPRYASPEQIRGQRLATTSDVYSLGVLLYELLTGQSPYEPNTSSRAAIESAALEQVPRSASDAVAHSDQPAETRRLRARRLRGDIDAVLAKALEKRPSDRYASAEQFGEDIRRLREGLPLIARGPGPLRRLSQVLRRNRPAVVAVGLLTAVVITVGSLALSYSLLAPRWAEERVRAAHLEILWPGMANDIWVLSFNNADALFDRHREPACRLDVAQRALQQYDAALRFGARLESVRVERQAVWLSMELTTRFGEALRIPDELQQSAPLAGRYAQEWFGTGVIPEIPIEDLEATSDRDLRTLGLVALLSGDVTTCLQAWQRMADYEADPLVEGLLGVLHLTQDAPERAYPRLLSAYRTYPELGFLATYLADAALGCGDVDFAGELLQRAETLEHLDPLRAQQRVWLRYLVATGQHEQAERLFFEEHGAANYVTLVQFARYLFDAGRERLALGILVERCGDLAERRETPAPLMRAFFELTQRWWQQLSDSERATVISTAIDESCHDPQALFRILRAYGTCLRRSQAFHREEALPLQAGALARDELLSTATHADLLDLHEVLQIENAHRWALFAKYPDDLRTAQANAWLTATDPVAETLRVDDAFRAWHLEHDRDTSKMRKILPSPEEDSRFGRWVDIDGDIAVVTTAQGLVVLRHHAGRWQREPVEIPEGMRVHETVVDAGRILALLYKRDATETWIVRLALFTYDEGPGRWTLESYLPLPEDCPTDTRIVLEGSTACVVPTVRGPIFFLEQNAPGAGWRMAYVYPPDSSAIWRHPHLADGTLTLIDQESGSSLHHFQRGDDDTWHHTKLPPPQDINWRWAVSQGDSVIGSATNNSNQPLSIPVLRPDAAGNWVVESDLVHVMPERERFPGQRLASDGQRLAVATGDPGYYTHQVEVFTATPDGWQHVAALVPPDLGYGDRAASFAISGSWVILGAPHHDAAGIDRGAVYLFKLDPGPDWRRPGVLEKHLGEP